jgi:queuine tRNA-ribosyltransferase
MPAVTYKLLAEDPATGARAGELHTPHGIVPTPIFMPVGTQATVKTTTPMQLEEVGAKMILGNAYHLGLRPGDDLIARMGGLHKFMNWNRPILTDSGGFQVFSLGDLRTVSESGVVFQSHLDGKEIFLTPERCMEIENNLGADVMMILDECPPFPTEKAVARASMERTLGWAARCKQAHAREDQALFGIIQGCTYPDLRAECADRMVALDFPGYAIGGLSVGEGPDLMCEMVGAAIPRLPKHKPRYLMGVGRPEDLLAGVGLGVDMFDCVIPTRCGRNGLAFTSQGRVKLRNLEHRESQEPIDPDCDCPACRHFTRAYIRHLLVAGEILGLTLMTLHNIRFYVRLMEGMRAAILEGRFSDFVAAHEAVYPAGR